MGVGFAAVAAGYIFIAAYDEEGNRIGEGGMFYIGGGAAFPVVDLHVGTTYFEEFYKPLQGSVCI